MKSNEKKYLTKNSKIKINLKNSCPKKLFSLNFNILFSIVGII
jgi:hypothetical protein